MKTKKLTNEKLKNILGNLPREKAPNNFEFNLMTRIKNKQFGDLEKKENKFLWIFVPSGSVVVAALLLFAILFDNPTFESPELSQPKLIPNKSEVVYVVVEENSNSRLQQTQFNSQNNLEAIRVVSSENDVVSKEKIAFPINNKKNVQLDKYLDESIPNSNLNGTLVSGGQREFEFRGFIPYGKSKSQIRKEKLDSLKKVEKIPKK